eukprot:CAMPEP_0173150474 /NCGR_PEP_ID=MMETSP1105-20130129/10986_1 /TAXON_ID=2985 /ORGANISM="Ochromonas sp., Strain BG-1" /LENGTH=237 /DNA_ID=CAMNT_0014065625 /DNA_START=66 /DNA_END=782 /DNA_ORIENTATION=+
MGIYILPELDNIRVLHGVIFIRRGFYREGVFRFRIDLPANYNEMGTYPLVTFTPPVFNPLIDPSTGRLDLTADSFFANEWNPDKHRLVAVVTFVKKIFFLKSYDDYAKVINEEARQLFNDDKEEFLSKVAQTVEDSLTRVYDTISTSNPLVFTEPKPAHEELVKEILLKRPTAGSGLELLGDTDKRPGEDDGVSREIFDRDDTALFETTTTTNFSHLQISSEEQIADLSIDSLQLNS